MACFLDTSALVKYYVAEPGSAWVRQTFDSEPLIFLAEIIIAEVAAALGVLQRRGEIDARHRREFWERFERDVVEQYDLVPMALDLIQVAAMLCGRHPLKAYDAVQLATGLALQARLSEHNSPLIFVSGDATLGAAAQAEGLTVDNPFWHTDLDPS
jgi:predicted nucleic acid-binding protein